MMPSLLLMMFFCRISLPCGLFCLSVRLLLWWRLLFLHLVFLQPLPLPLHEVWELRGFCMQMAAFTWHKIGKRQKRNSVCAIWLTKRASNPHCAASPRTLCVGTKWRIIRMLTAHGFLFCHHISIHAALVCFVQNIVQWPSRSVCLSVLQKHYCKPVQGNIAAAWTVSQIDKSSGYRNWINQ